MASGHDEDCAGIGYRSGDDVVSSIDRERVMLYVVGILSDLRGRFMPIIIKMTSENLIAWLWRRHSLLYTHASNLASFYILLLGGRHIDTSLAANVNEGQQVVFASRYGGEELTAMMMVSRNFYIYHTLLNMCKPNKSAGKDNRQQQHKCRALFISIHYGLTCPY